jgi:hypothetical protein
MDIGAPIHTDARRSDLIGTICDAAKERGGRPAAQGSV